MPAPQQIIDLVNRFERNYESYKSGNYNETQTRREFIDPFFEALGWDVSNKQGYAEAYKDVVHEYSQKTADTTEAPDYLFRIGGTRKFFVEAKKPSIKLADDIYPAFQLRRYAWTAKLPLSILTDFEEFAVYDCRIKPNKNDKPSTARINYYTYKDYLEKWDEIESIFSKDSILKGSFDKFAETNKGKRGTAEVDDAFLKEIEAWRETLAKNIALRNPKLSNRELNFAVQKIIDRIIFLRICEDRGIEEYGQLMNLQNGVNVYKRLLQIFTRADEKYNSGLFHFEKEKERPEAPDELTPKLSIDDKTLKDIIKTLYYPDSPYEFSVLPADILGHVYEQFLGKVIRLTPAHQAKIEEKPEVKKAGGVYYTPTYIVDYIVKNTLGKLLTEDTTPKQVSKIKILDPACGSGSFLIGAYQYLLDWHLKYYCANVETTGSVVSKPKEKIHRIVSTKKSPIYESSNGEWKLTTAERKRILLNNIYGVDIDTQAVEVTKLSLLLKVLEGETEETLNTQFKFFRERALPDLSTNIKCGNSLIGPDFYDGNLFVKTGHVPSQQLDDEERMRINVFDWQKEFPDVFKDGFSTGSEHGFDVVIGNPPYLRIQGLQNFLDYQISYFIKNYESAVKRFDLYLLFIEKGHTLLRNQGVLGFICPHKYLNSDFGSGIRSYLRKNFALDQIISFGNNMIFQKASTYTCLTFLSQKSKKDFSYYEINDVKDSGLIEQLINLSDNDFSTYNFANLSNDPWVLTNLKFSKVLEKIGRQPSTLGDLFENIFQGIVTGNDEIYFLKKIKEDKNEKVIKVFSQRENKIVEIERDILTPILKGEDVKRYSAPEFNYYCVYPYKLIDNKTQILSEKELYENYPLCYAYLKNYKSELTNLRKKYKTNPTYWYSCHRGRSIIDFEMKRIISQEISLGCNMTIDVNNYYHNTTVYSLTPNINSKENIFYWLAVLNSRLMWWFLSNTGNVLRGGYFRFKTNYLKPFPIRQINFKNVTETNIHEKVVDLVINILRLNNIQSLVNTPQEKESLQRQIDATDSQIDRLVYELYGLTEEEIKIVESP
ncbi:MAG: TaqI-like C-terminal specificity domain-containing protein [Melioribacteraceae bacterium]|nr:TaqI-like C-terminal specificity domain-containing protein [Melioribacteraceae bacterium]